MTSSTSFSERAASAAVARSSEFTLGAIEEATVRLRSWAAIRDVGLSGVPFLRLAGDSTLVCLPTAARANPHPQTGVTATSIESGDVAVVRGVSFGDVRRTVADVARELGLNEVGLTVEFHRGTEGFGTGSVVIPLGAGARMPLAAAGG